MMNTIIEITQSIIREFDSYATVDEKYAYLFQIGEQLPPMDSQLKSEANKVQGCQSDLWFDLRYVEGQFSLNADSDSMVIKGIAALLVRIVKNCPPEEVPQLDLDFIDRLEIWKLASERNNGLMAMLEHIKRQAVTALVQKESLSETGGEDA